MKTGRPANIIALVAFVLLTSVVAFAATTVLFVYPGNLEGWQPTTTAGASPSPSPTPSVTFVFGPATPPRGQGSVEFRIGSDGGAAAQMRQPNFAGTVLPSPTPTPDPDPEAPPIPPPAPNELTGLSYSTYVQQFVDGQAPYIILQIDTNGDSGIEDLLFFEPVYQSAAFCPSNPQATVVLNTWQTWNAFNGCWYSVFGTAGSGPGTNVVPLRTLGAALPTGQIANSASGLGGVRLVTGFGEGAWDNFIGNADAFSISVGDDSDVGPTTTVYDFEPQAPPSQSSTGVIISELRTSGPGPGTPSDIIKPGGRRVPPGRRPAAPSVATNTKSRPAARISPDEPPLPLEPPPCCDGDEYIELYNTTEADISVQSSDGTAGWAVVKRGASCLATPQIVAVIPNGTVIPARGHYLLTGNEYSLSAYAAGDGTTATSDQPLSGTIEGDRSVGLFNTTDTSNFNMETRLDAVGFDAGSGNFCDLLAEGAKLPPPRDSTAEYAFVRRMPPNSTVGGVPQDTNNNAADFFLVSTTPDQSVGDNPTPVLGAPGPENRTSPVRRNDVLTESLLAPTVGRSQSPNRTRDFTIETCADFGSIYIRRTFTNNTMGDIRRLRFRIIDITTFNSPGFVPGEGGQADLRVITSQTENLFVEGRGEVMVQGLTLEQPPNQPSPPCGGLNSSLSAGTITMATPLPPGQGIDVVFKFGVAQGGSFRIFVNLEALP